MRQSRQVCTSSSKLKGNFSFGYNYLGVPLFTFSTSLCSPISFFLVCSCSCSLFLPSKFFLLVSFMRSAHVNGYLFLQTKFCLFRDQSISFSIFSRATVSYPSYNRFLAPHPKLTLVDFVHIGVNRETEREREAREGRKERRRV